MFAFLVRQRAAALLVVVLLVVLGGWSYATLPRELDPEIELPLVLVHTALPGATPADVEALVTDPLEAELAGMRDLDHLDSVSAEGVSTVICRFRDRVSTAEALQRVRSAAGRAALPAEAQGPELVEFATSDFPILGLVLRGPVDPDVLADRAEALRKELEAIDGVRGIETVGERPRQVRVQVDPDLLPPHGVTLQDVVGALSAADVQQPVGEVDAGPTALLVRVPGALQDAGDVAAVPLGRDPRRPVQVGDVARVVDGHADASSLVRHRGQPAVVLWVHKAPGADAVAVAEAARAVARRHAGDGVDGVELATISDYARNVEGVVGDLQNGVITALLLVMVVIVLVMGVRNSGLVGLAIPLSLLAAMAVLQALGISLSMVVLFSLIMALGMLVDNAIVVVENIQRRRDLGDDGEQAAARGTREVAGALLGSTATSIAAFAPLALWTGIVGQTMNLLPRTVITVLLASLVIALVLLPPLAARLIRPRGPAAGERKGPRGTLARPYRRLLAWALDHRGWTLATGAGVLLASAGLYAAWNHGTSFMPEDPPDQVLITVAMPPGTDLEATDAVVRRIEGVLVQVADVEDWIAEVGVAPVDASFAATRELPDRARITVEFRPTRHAARDGEAVRRGDTERTVVRIREALAGIEDAEITVEPVGFDLTAGAPVEVEVRGDDVHAVSRSADQLRQAVAAIPGVVDAADDRPAGRPELRIEVDELAARQAGTSPAAVAGTLHTALSGQVAAMLRDGVDEIDVVVEVDPGRRHRPQDLLDLRVPAATPAGPTAVPLATVATAGWASGPAAIRHRDRDRVVTVRAGVAPGHNANEVRAAVQRSLDGAALPPGVRADLVGADDDQRDSVRFLIKAFLAALLGIALVLVAQFNGWRQPVVVLSSVALSVVGVLWGLLLTGMPFCYVMTGIGIIALSGVVVNNAIVLLQRVEQRRAGGWPLREALIDAGTTRLRPVLLTAATTMLGLLPMAVGISLDVARLRVVAGGMTAELWKPIAVGMIFGLGFSTVLTLVLVPVLYAVLDGLGGRAALAPPAPQVADDQPGQPDEGGAVHGGVEPVHRGHADGAAGDPAQLPEQVWLGEERGEPQGQAQHDGPDVSLHGS